MIDVIYVLTARRPTLLQVEELKGTGGMWTFIGTDEDEILQGTRTFDLIEGRGGNDTIHGGSSRDTIYGGDGDDRILTGGGPDIVYGGDGDDVIIDTWNFGGVEVLHGGAGNDIIRALYSDTLGPYGATSEWWMFGGSGDDRMFAAEGGVTHVYGGSGRDVISLSAYGGGEAYGGAGNDLLMSEARDRINDEADICGGRDAEGADVIMHGGRGNDVMYGYGSNYDTFVFKPGDGHDVIRNFAIGQDYPNDQIDLTAFEFDMTAEEVYETYAIDRGDRIVLNFGEDGRLVIHDNDYDRFLVPELTAQAVIDALIL